MINGRIDAMSRDSEDVSCVRLKSTSFCLHTDESAGLSNNTWVVAFVRFEDRDEIEGNDFSGKELSETVKGHHLFNTLFSYPETRDRS
jgi:hypothetical protein